MAKNTKNPPSPKDTPPADTPQEQQGTPTQDAPVTDVPVADMSGLPGVAPEATPETTIAGADTPPAEQTSTDTPSLDAPPADSAAGPHVPPQSLPPEPDVPLSQPPATESPVEDEPLKDEALEDRTLEHEFDRGGIPMNAPPQLEPQLDDQLGDAPLHVLYKGLPAKLLSGPGDDGLVTIELVPDAEEEAGPTLRVHPSKLEVNTAAVVQELTETDKEALLTEGVIAITSDRLFGESTSLNNVEVYFDHSGTALVTAEIAEAASVLPHITLSPAAAAEVKRRNVERVLEETETQFETAKAEEQQVILFIPRFKDEPATAPNNTQVHFNAQGYTRTSLATAQSFASLPKLGATWELLD